jgi:hypothetical protein
LVHKRGRDHGKTPACIACARRLNSGVKGEKVRLTGHGVDKLYYVA